MVNADIGPVDAPTRLPVSSPALIAAVALGLLSATLFVLADLFARSIP